MPPATAYDASNQAAQPFRIFTTPYPLITSHSPSGLSPLYSRLATPSVMYPKIRGRPRR